MVWKALSIAAALASVAAVALAEEIPQGDSGIASKYPGDVGIEKDPDVIFRESFDSAKAIDDLKGKPWTDISNTNGKCLELVKDAPPGAAAGGQSIKVAAHRGQDSGGHLFTSKMGAHDEAYVRYYVKFAADAGYWHHFVGMSGTTDPKPWPMGKAGLRPSGTERFGSGLEPDGSYGKFPPPGRWIFYTYWCEMRSYEGPNGTRFFGNSFTSPEPMLAPRDKWTCCERMIRLNSAPDKADGAQAFWIDGKLAGWWGPGGDKGHWAGDNWVPGGEPWPGFLWRKTMDLKINQFTLSSYVSDSGFKNTDEWSKKHPDLKMNSQEAVVSFDEIVMAKRYVGPISQAKKPAAEPESKPAGAPSAAPKPPSGNGAAEAEAGKLFQLARQAEQMGQRDVARKLYAQVVEKYPETEAAKQAKAKLN